MPTDAPALPSAVTAGSDVRAHLAELGDQVRAVAADLPAGEDDVTSMLEPRVPDVAGDLDDVDELDELVDEDDLDVPRREHHVTGVLVAHDGVRWLPAVLTALHRSARRPDRSWPSTPAAPTAPPSCWPRPRRPASSTAS